MQIQGAALAVRTVTAFATSLSLLLSGCFGGGTDATVASTATGSTTPTSTSTTTTTPSAAATKDSLVLLTENWQLSTGESSSVRITAVLKDAANVLMANEPVAFSASSGNLQIIQTKTDELGNAIAILSTPQNPVPRTITLAATARSGAASATLVIDVSGTKMQLSGPTSAIAAGASADIGIKLSAGDGGVLANKLITVESTLGNALNKTSVTTDKQGEATVRVTDNHNASDVITFKAMDGTVVATFNLAVSADGLSFALPASNAEVALGALQTVSVRLLRGGVPSVGETVSFSATRGVLSAPQATTDGSGFAVVTVTSNNAGGATVTASTASETSTQTFEFVATTPTAMTLEAAPKIVSIGSKSTVTATVRDANKNLVKNRKVQFNLADYTGGALSLGEVNTNSLGQASTVYTAGVQPSGDDGVTIQAWVQGSSSVSGTAKLTVDPQNVRISFGTGNELFEPNPAQYRKPYVIQVNDNGVPVSNANVQVTVYPVTYLKGRYIAADSNLDGQEDHWSNRSSTTVYCPSEDLNRNGLLDSNETDLNGDGQLTPPPVVTIAQTADLSPTVSKATVTSDTSGFGFFDITYPQDHANWLEVEIIAQTTLAGRETTYKTRTYLQGLDKDFNDLTIAPPGYVSPFGSSASCNNAN